MVHRFHKHPAFQIKIAIGHLCITDELNAGEHKRKGTDSMKTIDTKAILLAAAVAGVALANSAAPAAAADSEKCYGVAAAGKNDCATATSSCAGTSKADNQTDAFIAVPAGLCGKLAGGSLEPKAS